jgi:aminoglycoside N3'-acetyltransferase
MTAHSVVWNLAGQPGEVLNGAAHRFDVSRFAVLGGSGAGRPSRRARALLPLYWNAAGGGRCHVGPLSLPGERNRPVTEADIRAGFERLGLMGRRVVLHSSMRSFGHVEGGAGTVVAACVAAFETILVPAFCFDSNAPPPPGDRPLRNGTDYTFYDNWSRPPLRWVVESAGIDPRMGIVSRRFAALADRVRSDHPWHSWVGYGSRSSQFVSEHPWNTTNLPLERLADADGYLVLVGVTLTSCTAIHVAEERAGRRSFIRWMTDRTGVVRRVRASGCAKGFDNLMAHCRPLFSETSIGQCRVLATRLEPFIEQAAALISSQPLLTMCSPGCVRCRDSVAGGPLE